MAGSKLLLKKFQGSLVGNLVGDCLGEPFEFVENITNKNLMEFFSKLKLGQQEPGSLPYTDDTVMTKELIKSLIEHKGIDQTDLAKKFTDAYFLEPNRGYGVNVCQVFNKLKTITNTDDILKPAKDQFNGSGSYGNGAAMRTTPVGLFFYERMEDVIIAAKDQSLVTHSHKNGYNGAILQALAVCKALLMDPAEPVEPIEFILDLQKQMEIVEKENQPYFTERLKRMEQFLRLPNQVPSSTIIEELGNDVSALESVPTAIYAFLVSNKSLEGIRALSKFERTIHYAIGLGGDTDTIACMAGGICGAYLGLDLIPQYLIQPCEGEREMVKLGELLFEAHSTRK